MRSLFQFLWRFKYFILFLLTEAFCFYLIYQNNNFHHAAMVNSTNSIAANINQSVASFKEYFNLNPDRKTLLVLGGSLGSRRINQLIAKEIVNFVAQGVQVIWQCGKFYLEEYKHYSDKENIQVL